MSNPIIKKYPLDLTGENPNNLVINEPHELDDSAGDDNRVFVLNYGSFYTRGLVVRDSAGKTLTPRTDYIATYLYEDATKRTGLEVMGAIVIVNPNVTSPVYVDAQYVGGDYAQSTDALQQTIDALADDTRPVEWGNIIGKPTEFPPGGHLHALWELYGFEYVVTELERIVKAIQTGDQAAFDEIRQLIQEAEDRQQQYTDDQFDAQLDPHLADFDNPHRVTKAQVGLGNVPNNAMASQAEAEAGTTNVRMMSPLRVKQAIDVQVQPILQRHIDDKTNPHSVTKAQVGLGNVDNFLTASQGEAEAGTRNDRFMTPLRTAQAITEQAGTLLQAHIDDKTNPHNVTKAQVGLGNVDNFLTASRGEAETGTRNDRFMTPLRTAQAITEQAGTLLQAHIDDKDNPHSVTKAQVGLGSVSNYAISTVAEAQDGTVNNKYMTPLRTAQAINVQVTPILQTHIDDKTNPHNVTKAQVGLSNVDNYATATNAQAQAGTATNRFLTPANLGAVMTTHSSSGDHDSRYVRLNAAVNASVRVNNGNFQAYVNGSWRTVWPPQWQ